MDKIKELAEEVEQTLETVEGQLETTDQLKVTTSLILHAYFGTIMAMDHDYALVSKMLEPPREPKTWPGQKTNYGHKCRSGKGPKGYLTLAEARAQRKAERQRKKKNRKG